MQHPGVLVHIGCRCLLHVISTMVLVAQLSTHELKNKSASAGRNAAGDEHLEQNVPSIDSVVVSDALHVLVCHPCTIHVTAKYR